MAGRKIFVGSLPDGIQDAVLRAEFSRFGQLEDIFVKPGCEPGRQWAMVTYATQQQAQVAKEATDRILTLPGGDRPVEVMIARNQAKVGPSSDPLSPTPLVHVPLPVMTGDGQGPTSSQPRKIFVGSLPDSITEMQLREEFSKYGAIMDVYLKMGCEKNKQWAFLTFGSTEEAELAKASADRTLRFPGADAACEVMLARNQGMNGRDPLRPITQPILSMTQGPTKIFVGSLPDGITETVLRAEFSKYGQITDVFLKTGCETNKQWAFIIFATNAQAQHAKDATDRVLVVAGATSPCEVMFAKSQGKNGQDPMVLAAGGMPMALPGLLGGGMPLAIPAPPPMSALPAQYAWRVYQTPQGLPYYHNHTTGATQWECPVELQYPALSAFPAQAAQAQQASLYGAMYAMAPATAALYRPY